ncbi:MAG TPA: hypothetical protein VMF11_02590 [Candidatus Baltobacteraceae bacterium]|nr:hypothetical protein [Candidatus Baltobacteraceae bacterium]
MKKRIKWRWVALAAGGVLAIYVIVEVILAGIGTPPLPPDQTGITLRGGHVLGNRITTKSWSFDYTTAQLSPDGTVGTVEGVHDGIVFKHGKPYLRITAERISVDTLSLNFTAIGKVTVTLIGDPLKRSFDTDLVIWTNGSKMLLMQHPSFLHSGHHTLEFGSVAINFATDQIHFGSIEGSTQIEH